MWGTNNDYSGTGCQEHEEMRIFYFPFTGSRDGFGDVVVGETFHLRAFLGSDNDFEVATWQGGSCHSLLKGFFDAPTLAARRMLKTIT